LAAIAVSSTLSNSIEMKMPWTVCVTVVITMSAIWVLECAGDAIVAVPVLRHLMAIEGMACAVLAARRTPATLAASLIVGPTRLVIRASCSEVSALRP